jgi:UDP-N-acetylglucosamine--N-acetylmuramyl-(pentapeptide) pyrophosphoryl-undecaprenol N-acetylglucosamine transferase
LKRIKILIAGGGTGGHIYPGLSLAESMIKICRQNDIECEVQFVGTSLGLESKIIPGKGFRLHLIQSGKFNFTGRIFEKIKTLIKLPIGLLQSIILLIQENPSYVIGVGGYASAPFLFATRLLGYPAALWEPNAIPGMANRLLSWFVKKAFVVFADAQKYLKSNQVVVAGMPLREEIELAREQILANSNTPREIKKFTLLCFGGSQGSVFLNNQLSDFAIELAKSNSSPDIHILHQTGKSDFHRIKQKYNGLSFVDVYEYIDDMPKFYKQASLLFCRGGAGTLAEASAFGVVPIVVPLPAADNHQQKNAESLVQKKAGFMILQDRFEAGEFKSIIEKFRLDSDLRESMQNSLLQLVPPRSADQIAKNILQEIGI